jgi:hypothetical protein
VPADWLTAVSVRVIATRSAIQVASSVHSSTSKGAVGKANGPSEIDIMSRKSQGAC